MDDELRANLGKLRAGHGKLRADFIGSRTMMMEWFERVEDKLTRMSEDVSVNMGAVSHQYRLRQAERESADRLTAMVPKMEQQIPRLETDVHELKKGQ